MRAFFAVRVPEPTAERLLSLVPPVSSIRKVKPASVHVTLAFFSSAPDDLPARLASLSLADIPTFHLTPGPLILLPESGPIRVIAASITAGSEPLRALHTHLHSALSQFAELSPDPRPFLPHLTLARCDPPLPQQLRAQTPIVPRQDLSFPVASLTLFRSVPVSPSPSAIQHEPLHDWPLAPQ